MESTDKIYRHRYPAEIILLCVRWYLRYKLSLRDLEEIMLERNVDVSYETIRQWVQKFAPLYDSLRRKKQTAISLKWNMDETYIKIKGKQYYYYRAIDSQGQVIDFYLSLFRDGVAAEIFFRKAISTAGAAPEEIISDLDKSYPVAIKHVCPKVKHTTLKFLNNIIEQDHRRIKSRAGPMKGFKNPVTARVTLKGIESVFELSKFHNLKGRKLDRQVYNCLLAA